MDLKEVENYWGGIIGDAMSILKSRFAKKKVREENIVAYLFNKEQVRQVLSYFKPGEINVWVDEGVYCLSRYTKEQVDEYCKCAA